MIEAISLPSSLLLIATSLLVLGVLAVLILRLRTRLAVLEDRASQLSEALDFVHIFIYTKDSEHRFTYGNKITLERLGVTAKQLCGTRAEDHFPPIAVARINEVDTRVLNHGESSSEEVVYGDDLATRRVYLEVKQPLRDKNRNIVGLLGVSTDMTEVHRLRCELEWLSTTDYLTGLANRRLFDDRLTLALEHLSRNSVPIVLVLIDVDHFKKYNDSYGHPAGDVVLQAVAEALRSVAVRATDLVARVGGEEFALLLGGADLDGARSIAEAARAAVQARALPHEENPPQVVTISLGIAAAHSDDTSEALYQRADGALYAAKDSGRNCVCAEAVA